MQINEVIQKIKRANLVVWGIVMLVAEVIILTANYLLDLNTNILLWTALGIMTIAILLIIAQIRRESAH